VNKKQAKTKFRKAPEAPKRFKSAFMFFSCAMQTEIRNELKGTNKNDVPNIAKLIGERWRNLSQEKRSIWIKKAEEDKKRYEVEKALYNGPWKIPATERAKKHPEAPKRPMSAFLSLARHLRRVIKSENPELSNAEVSKVLATRWRNAPEEERNIHIKKEAMEREMYNVKISKWRNEHEAKLEDQRKRRQEIAMSVVQNSGTISHDMFSSGQSHPHANSGNGHVDYSAERQVQHGTEYPGHPHFNAGYTSHHRYHWDYNCQNAKSYGHIDSYMPYEYANAPGRNVLEHDMYYTQQHQGHGYCNYEAHAAWNNQHSAYFYQNNGDNFASGKCAPVVDRHVTPFAESYEYKNNQVHNQKASGNGSSQTEYHLHPSLAEQTSICRGNSDHQTPSHVEIPTHHDPYYEVQYYQHGHK